MLNLKNIKQNEKYDTIPFIKLKDMHISNTHFVRIQVNGTLGFTGGSAVKNLSANAGDAGPVLGLGRFPGEGNGNPLQHSCLGNPIDREARQATVSGVANIRYDLETKQHHQAAQICT